MKFIIKNRFTLEVMFEQEAESLKLAIMILVKSRANLSGADLSRANLSGANLYGEELDKNPIQLIGLKYNFILITKIHIKIGCKLYKASEWWKFTDKEISAMDSGALVWWKQYKTIIKSLHKKHCEEK